MKEKTASRDIWCITKIRNEALLQFSKAHTKDIKSTLG